MLNLTEPLKVTRSFAFGGKTGEVTVYLEEPDDAWFELIFLAMRMEEGKAKVAAFEGVFAPEVVAPFVVGWEGIGGAEPVPCTPENVVKAMKKKAFRELVHEGVNLAWCRRAEGNSEASPVPSTDEAPANKPSGASDAEPSPPTAESP